MAVVVVKPVASDCRLRPLLAKDAVIEPDVAATWEARRQRGSKLGFLRTNCTPLSCCVCGVRSMPSGLESVRSLGIKYGFVVAADG